MKYCIKYRNSFRYLKEIDEMIVSPVQWEALDFDKYPKCRFILDIYAEEFESTEYMLKYIKSMLGMKLNNKNRMAILLSYDKADVCEDLQELGVEYFFFSTINSTDQLRALVEKGVSDVYVTNQLGFNLVDVSAYLKANDVTVRVFPNVAQSAHIFGDSNSLTDFYILPNGTNEVEKYVDVFEFFGSSYDGLQLSVIYNTYKKKTWEGSADILIVGLDAPIPVECFPMYFAEKRVNCQKKCNLGYPCNFCGRVAEFAKVLQENGIKFGVENDGED